MLRWVRWLASVGVLSISVRKHRDLLVEGLLEGLRTLNCNRRFDIRHRNVLLRARLVHDE